VDADITWFSLFRALFLQGTVAEIGCSAFTLYCAIKAHADFHDGVSIPSQKDLATQTGLSERQIQNSLKVLEQHGLLEKKKEWKRNVYQLREKIILDGAVATWTYLPSGLKQARHELQNFLLTGDAKDAKVIHIEKLVIENLVVGDQINIASPTLDLDDIKDPRIRRIAERHGATGKESPAESSPDQNAPEESPHPHK
jgi:DNA-binding transcriptional regulator YhcF (GntR family)